VEASRSKVWVCDVSVARSVGSNPGAGMDVCLLCRLLSGRCLADHSSRGALSSMMCLIEYDYEAVAP
jgi:DTW domain-containing protein YfiP